MHLLCPTYVANQVGGTYQYIYQFVTKTPNSLIFQNPVQMPCPPKASLILQARYDPKPPNFLELYPYPTLELNTFYLTINYLESVLSAEYKVLNA